MDAKRERRAQHENQPVEIGGDLARVEDRKKNDRRETADQSDAQQFEYGPGPGAGAHVTVGQMTVTLRTGRHPEGESSE